MEDGPPTQAQIHQRLLTFKDSFLEAEFIRKWDDQNLWPATVNFSVCLALFLLLLFLRSVADIGSYKFCPCREDFWGDMDSLKNILFFTNILAIVLTGMENDVGSMSSRCGACSHV